MITEECVTAIWRMYPKGTTPDQVDQHIKFVGVCFVMFITPELIYVKGLRADMDRYMQRKFLEKCNEKGIEIVRAVRESSRSLPMGRRLADGDITETRISELMARVTRPVRSTKPPLFRRRDDPPLPPEFAATEQFPDTQPPSTP